MEANHEEDPIGDDSPDDRNGRKMNLLDKHRWSSTHIGSIYSTKVQYPKDMMYSGPLLLKGSGLPASFKEVPIGTIELSSSQFLDSYTDLENTFPEICPTDSELESMFEYFMITELRKKKTQNKPSQRVQQPETFRVAFDYECKRGMLILFNVLQYHTGDSADSLMDSLSLAMVLEFVYDSYPSTFLPCVKNAEPKVPEYHVNQMTALMYGNKLALRILQTRMKAFRTSVVPKNILKDLAQFHHVTDAPSKDVHIQVYPGFEWELVCTKAMTNHLRELIKKKYSNTKTAQTYLDLHLFCYYILACTYKFHSNACDPPISWGISVCNHLKHLANFERSVLQHSLLDKKKQINRMVPSRDPVTVEQIERLVEKTSHKQIFGSNATAVASVLVVLNNEAKLIAKNRVDAFRQSNSGSHP